MLLAKLYRSARLFDGARVRKTCSPPATPHHRLVADARTSDAVRSRQKEIYAGLDPVLLLRDIRAVQERLTALADTPPAMRPDRAAQPIDLFLASLRTAWKDGAIWPTDRRL